MKWEAAVGANDMAGGPGVRLVHVFKLALTWEEECGLSCIGPAWTGDHPTEPGSNERFWPMHTYMATAVVLVVVMVVVIVASAAAAHLGGQTGLSRGQGRRGSSWLGPPHPPVAHT
jgi:hypothetical protein